MKNQKWKYKVDIKRFLKMDQGNETAAHISGISHSIAAVLRDKLPSKFFDEDNNDFCDFIDAVQSLEDVAPCNCMSWMGMSQSTYSMTG